MTALPHNRTPTFREFVLSMPIHDTPLGDFVKEIKGDRDFPAANSWAEVEQYLICRDACPDARRIARRLWRLYAAEGWSAPAPKE